MKDPLLLMASPSLRIPSMTADMQDHTDHMHSEAFDMTHHHILKHYPKMHSFLIVRGGKLIFERYYNGHEREKLNDLRSATKSFTSILAGIAVERNELPALDDQVLAVLSKYTTRKTDPLLQETLTLRRLLTMTTGLEWQTGNKLGEPLIHRFHRSKNWLSYALSLPVVQDNVGTFQYRSVDSHLISALLTECCGLDAFSYAREHLFGPLGIDYAAWTPSPEGHSMGHIGLFLTSRDMAKFGLCCLQGGVWQGKQVIPEAWLEQALTSHIEGYPAYGDYGFQWWNGKMNGQPFACAHGHGGQQIYLFPKSDTVVVFTADSRVSRWKNPRPLLQQYILNALE
ncbi:serine hydrolase domain-containing protein [Paenibacillus pini]|uniref:Beta-lactamase class C and other penicillin binding proteins n=1 Tax=Paenibacillus pini JCM 16418 TaxID=1236976 RepID=W7YXY1_9BACL|nr:serine hydrolase [Paenibacillus pini]GAF09531.1 beta-lactamase class C and other penicillin binding proteins [Paenibacillus pini JCM 16418]